MSEQDLNTTVLQQILVRLQKGDEDARNELCRRMEHRLETLCHKMLGDFASLRPLEETSDVLQNASVRLLRSLEEVRPENTRAFFALAGEQVRRELLDMARHHSAARRRPKRRQRIVPLHAAAESAVDAEPPSPQESPEELERWHAFHEAVAGLPAQQREVLSLIFYSGWSQAEVADLLQLSVRHVRRHWHSACMSLKKRLADGMPTL